MGVKYRNIAQRLRANAHRMRCGCLLWKGPKRGRTGDYPMFNVRMNGQHRQIAAHRAALVAAEIRANRGGRWDLFGALYELYSIAGFEADHSGDCHSPSCINAKHLVWREKDDHLRVTIERRKARKEG